MHFKLFWFVFNIFVSYKKFYKLLSTSPLTQSYFSCRSKYWAKGGVGADPTCALATS